MKDPLEIARIEAECLMSCQNELDRRMYKFLLSRGWEHDKHGGWYKFDVGGYSIEYAFQQEMKDLGL